MYIQAHCLREFALKIMMKIRKKPAQRMTDFFIKGLAENSHTRNAFERGQVKYLLTLKRTSEKFHFGRLNPLNCILVRPQQKKNYIKTWCRHIAVYIYVNIHMYDFFFINY